MFNLTNSKIDVFSILAFLLLSFTVLGGCSKPEVMTTKYGDKVTLDNTHKERVIKVVAEFNAIKDSKKIPGVQIGLAYPVDNDLEQLFPIKVFLKINLSLLLRNHIA